MVSTYVSYPETGTLSQFHTDSFSTVIPTVLSAYDLLPEQDVVNSNGGVRTKGTDRPTLSPLTKGKRGGLVDPDVVCIVRPSLLTISLYIDTLQ